MRSFLKFVVFAGLGVLYLYQKQHDSTPADSVKTAAVAKATPAAQLTPAPRGQASEYNYMKRALDRAASVRDQARDQTRAAQNP
jgi:hypothetical protein